MDFEADDELWQQAVLEEAWRLRMISLQLRKQDLLPPPPPPSPCREFVITPIISVEESSVDHCRYSSLTSFLEIDCSFFSPWNWSPNSPENLVDARGKQRMIFEPDSFFSADQQLYDMKSHKEDGI